MINNASLQEIGKILHAAETVLIFPHVNLDGDALGSSAALCRVLRSMGKDAWILMEEEVPAYIRFMDTAYCTRDTDVVFSPDVCICVDCSEESRFPKLAEKYHAGKYRVCIDHHAAGKGIGDYYYIDEGEAAAAQIIYQLITAMEWEIDRKVAESLYTAIVTDTGSFQYSNTTAQTHAIASALMEIGIDHVDIAVKLYQSVSLKKLQVESSILGQMEVFAQGKAAISYVSRAMLEELDATLDDAEGAIDMIRNIDGVEIAVFLKEKDGRIKVSMRAKSYATVKQIAAKYGGGGHEKAAGCTLDMKMEKAVALMKDEVTRYWEN